MCSNQPCPISVCDILSIHVALSYFLTSMLSIIRDLFPPSEKKKLKFPFSEEERKFQKKSRQTKIFGGSSGLVYHMKARVAFRFFWFIGSYGCFRKTAEDCNLHYKIPCCMEFSNCEARNVFYIV